MDAVRVAAGLGWPQRGSSEVRGLGWPIDGQPADVNKSGSSDESR
jgi:hypothetical protein